MPSTRNPILRAFKASIDAIPTGDFGDIESIIGVWRKNKLSREPRAEIWFRSDHGRHVDTKSRQELRVVTKLKFKYDESDTDTLGETDLEQASELYDVIHAKIETDINNASTPDTPFYGLSDYLTIAQEAPGIQPYGFADGDDYMGIGEVWLVTYKRTEGST